MNQEQLAALDLLCGYISFGLAIYAITSLCGLLFVRYKLSVFPHLTRKIARYYGGVIVLIVLEMSRQIWDSLYVEHFPLVVARAILPAVCVVVGNAVFGIMRLEYIANETAKKHEPEATDEESV